MLRDYWSLSFDSGIDNVCLLVDRNFAPDFWWIHDPDEFSDIPVSLSMD